MQGPFQGAQCPDYRRDDVGLGRCDDPRRECRRIEPVVGNGDQIGVERADATRYAFLLATPVILGAGAKTLLDDRKLSGLTAQLDVVAIGLIV